MSPCIPGWTIHVGVGEGMLDMQVSVPKSAFEKTMGLLGVYNGDEEDDLRTPNGTTVPSNSSTRVIHYSFGELCKYQPWGVPKLMSF